MKVVLNILIIPSLFMLFLLLSWRAEAIEVSCEAFGRDRCVIIKQAKVRYFSAEEKVHSVAISRNGKLLAGGGGEKGFVYLWEADSGKLIQKLKGHSLPLRVEDEANLIPVIWMAFSPNNKVLLTFGPDRALILWDVASGKSIYSVETKASGWKWSPSGKHVVGVTGTSPSMEGTLEAKLMSMKTTVVVLDVLQKKEARFSIAKSSVASVAFFRNDETILTAHNEEVRLFREFGGKKPDSTFSAIRIWDLSGKEIKCIGDRALTTSLSVSRDGKVLVTGDFNRGVNIWDSQKGTRTQSLKHKSISKIKPIETWPIWSALCEEEGKLVTYDGLYFVIWDLRINQETYRHEHRSASVFGFPGQVALSKEGEVLYFVDNQFRVQSIPVGRKVLN